MAATSARSESFVSGDGVYAPRMPGGMRGPKIVYDGKRKRENPVVRKTIDFNPTIVRYLQERCYRDPISRRPHLQPTMDCVRKLEPAGTYMGTPANAFTTKFVQTVINKVRRPVNALTWTPEGKRMITGSHSGEFTLWNGLQFNFETILQAHSDPIRCMIWSHDGTWLVSSDERGTVKYWQASMNNVKAFQAHTESVRDLSFCPTDFLFASASDDRTIRVWDFREAQMLVELKGHHWDAKCVDWHPYKSLLASGSKDNLLKLWCPKSGKEICTMHGHKNTVTKAKWNRNGNWLATGSRDQIVKIWDIRTMRTLSNLKGHNREITSMAWHPFHEEVLCSGSFDGTILFWVVGEEKLQAEIADAHDGSVWDIDWHPLGHMLASGSNDQTARFWTRNRPGDEMKDKYNVNQLPEETRKEALANLAQMAKFNPQTRFGMRSAYPGHGADVGADDDGDDDDTADSGVVIPGLGSMPEHVPDPAPGAGTPAPAAAAASEPSALPSTKKSRFEPLPQPPPAPMSQMPSAPQRWHAGPKPMPYRNQMRPPMMWRGPGGAGPGPVMPPMWRGGPPPPMRYGMPPPPGYGAPGPHGGGYGGPGPSAPHRHPQRFPPLQQQQQQQPPQRNQHRR